MLNLRLLTGHTPRLTARPLVRAVAFSSTPSPEKPIILKKLGIYGELSKFRLSSLVVMTTGAGFLATGLPIDWAVLSATCFGTALCAASANTFNQTIEAKYDANMNRTKSRPLPSGRVSTKEAIGWGIASGVAGTSMLLLSSNPIVAALGAGNIFLYAGPYTALKRKSEINTWVGSIVGAIPPVMGWAAATGGQVLAGDPLFLAGILFLWQFPHFFALSWLHREDYARGGFQMVAVNDTAGTRSGALVLRYSAYLSAIPVAAYGLDLTSSMFAFEGTAVNAYLMYLAYKFNQNQSNANARRVFLCSLWYLPLMLASFVLFSKRWTAQDENKEKSQVYSAL
jgi:protoheme IX farnesyltransferase